MKKDDDGLDIAIGFEYTKLMSVADDFFCTKDFDVALECFSKLCKSASNMLALKKVQINFINVDGKGSD